MEWTVTAERAGMTAGAFLRREAGLSARALRELKKRPSGITRNGEDVTAGDILRAGDRLFAAVEDGCRPPAACAGLPVLYEDDWCVAVGKPAGMPTHPSQGHHGDTLTERFASAGCPLRPVNRLDRHTSGVVLLACHRAAAGILSAALANGEFEKTYLAVTTSPLDPPAGRMTDRIGRVPGSIITRRVVPENEDGDEALTDYRTLASAGGRYLLELTPRTGRTHQLRVQLASRGAPIAGDDLYGGMPIAGRTMLHAARLSFPHPATGKTVTVCAPLPDDFIAVFPTVTTELSGNEEKP